MEYPLSLSLRWHPRSWSEDIKELYILTYSSWISKHARENKTRGYICNSSSVWEIQAFRGIFPHLIIGWGWIFLLHYVLLLICLDVLGEHLAHLQEHPITFESKTDLKRSFINLVVKLWKTIKFWKRYIIVLSKKIVDHVRKWIKKVFKMSVKIWCLALS